ncbi:MAG: DUF937 domain-containing protein [Prevotellaceae bacterium]|nr:DUF937 domain-containing protein [Prevotellaceae bacterium]
MKALITSEMINKASTLLNEKHADVSNGVSTIIPSILGVLLKKEHSPQLKNILDEAGNLDINSNVKHLFEEKPCENQQNIGDDFLQHLLGDKAADFTDPIAEKTGMTKVATNELISMVAPIVVGFLGKKVVTEKWTMPQLVEQIDKEKSGFKEFIPAGVIKAFNLHQKLESDEKAAPVTHHHAHTHTHAQTHTQPQTHAQPTPTVNNITEKPEKPSKGKSWIWWLLLLIVLILLFCWWRSCKGHKEQVHIEHPAVVEPVKSTVTKITTTIGNALELTLPDGIKINAHTGGVEDKMIKFLESDEYKNATAEQLKNIWFEFDKVDFVFGSSKELQEGSQVQLDNIVAILKSFKDAKVKLGAYSDVIGSDESNLRLSHDRAVTVESMLDKAGIGSQIVKIQGYGEEFAKHAASEPDSARAKDRDIALRFVK